MTRPTLAAALLLFAPAASAQPDLRVIEGMRHYQEGHFDKARDVLVTAVESPALTKAQRIRARLFLASSYFALNDLAASKGQLLALARSDPDAQIDPIMFVPEIIAMFDDAKEEIVREMPPEMAKPVVRPVEKKVEIVPPPPPVQRPVVTHVPVPVQEPSLALAFVPFGVGQFTHGEQARGWIYLGAEAAAYAVALGGLAYFESMKVEGQFLQYGSFEDPGQAQFVQGVYLAGFWTGSALAVIGIVDAVLTRRSQPARLSFAVGPSGGAVEVRF
jgi:hypothetical protein